MPLQIKVTSQLLTQMRFDSVITHKVGGMMSPRSTHRQYPIQRPVHPIGVVGIRHGILEGCPSPSRRGRTAGATACRSGRTTCYAESGGMNVDSAEGWSKSSSVGLLEVHDLFGVWW